MTNVCLIIPPSPFLLDERVFMSLGVLKVAASLEAAGVPVFVMDLAGVSDPEKHIKNLRVKADVFGITATTPQFPAACRIANSIREAYPEAKIVIGGPHATLVHAALPRSARAKNCWDALLSRFDCIVAGDGELAIFEAIKPIAPQVIDADGRKSKLFLSDATLSATPWPARHLVDVKSYRYSIDGAPSLSLISQLGCPFACGFCAGRHSPMLRHIRRRPADDVVAELVHLNATYGHTGFMFYDDELNVNKQLVELMGKIYDVSKGEWRLRGFIKAELFTEDQASAMAKAGFRTILVGFESASPRILENINKRASRDDNSRCCAIARKNGLKVKALMSLGNPGESEKTIEETRRWLIDEAPSDFDATVITPYPGSPYYDDAVANEGVYTYTCGSGDSLHMREIDYTAEADYYKGIPGEYVSHVWTDHMAPHELVQGRDKLEASVREKLKIPFPAASHVVNYEQSMGQTPLRGASQDARHSYEF